MLRQIALPVFLGLVGIVSVSGQRPGYWQQRADYTLEVSLDVKTHRYTGTQAIRYTNNSPDTLRRLFFHLYVNAFRKGSGMDHRNRYLPDPDERVGNRINNLTPDKEGYLKVSTLQVNGTPQQSEESGTILEVQLTDPILPGTTADISLRFDGQVPIQIRRSGRDSEEGIAYSMSQWYPKLCQYDADGWHPNPYIGREFYGIWGDWDVKLTLDKTYIVAATGYLQNPETIGYGYEAPGTTVRRPDGPTLTWHFKAPNVHDFVWAADPDYLHTRVVYADTLALHFFYQKDANKTGAWDRLPEHALRMFAILNRDYGAYPYLQYSFIQGGDGGMEYPMATLITGQRTMGSLVGVALHELVHSWYQMVLATNEALYGWMDEGFDTYVTDVTRHFVDNGTEDPDPFFTQSARKTMETYRALVNSRREEPLTTHADHFETNFGYGISSYIKGAMYLHQLSYVVGREAFRRGMLRYYHRWKFHHPTPADFLKVMEDETGLVLDWYNEYFVMTTKTVDYAISEVAAAPDGRTATVRLRRVGLMPMPQDLVITYTDSTQAVVHIPLNLMRGTKANEQPTVPRTVAPDWNWVQTDYSLQLPEGPAPIARLELDPTQRMADIERSNNVWVAK